MAATLSPTMTGQKNSLTICVTLGVLTSLLLVTTGLTIYSFIKCNDLESRLSKLEWFIERKINEFTPELKDAVGEVHLRTRRDTTDQLSDLSLHELLSLRGQPGRDGKDGQDGRDGQNGRDGRDGINGQVGSQGPPGRDGQDGTAGPPGRDGQDGAAGHDGQDGADGADGQNCDCSTTGLASTTPAIKSEINLNVTNSISNQLAHIMESIEELRTGEQHEHTDNPTTSYTQSGSTYIRWGRTSCGNNSQLLYSGFAAGRAHTDEGGSSENACLPLQPEWNQWSTMDTGSWIHGAEYETYHNAGIFPNEAHDKNVPCAQCYTTRRSAIMMIPAKRTCPNSWTKEYEGYLMTDHNMHKRSSNYACVDAQPEYIAGTQANTNGALFYFVQAACASTLHCPPYINSAELTCVVCSK